MKLRNVLKGAALAGFSVIATSANAGISSTAYLELNDLFVQVDTSGNFEPDNVSPLDFIRIVGGSRGTKAFSNYNGVSDSSEVSSNSATADSNAELVCTGPSCGVLGLSDNGQSVANGNLVASDAFHFSASDAAVTGNALGNGASGFTYAEASIASGNSESGAASSGIANDINTIITLDVLNSINLRFSGLVDYFVDAFISSDLALDDTQGAVASSKVSLELSFLNLTTGQTVNIDGVDGFQRSDIAIDSPGLNDLFSFSGQGEEFLSGWATVDEGMYQLNITQTSEVQASLVPAPTSIAIAAFGLLGLGLTARRKQSK
ncbi:EDSAP-1 family PEP-CTERM protein [Alteromonas genovensis]|jgi:hypothetical protein|uniref:EDSAP-1 family PEP-CTERM protein n=1 Tax=Alteromonas genovensis TaxID=471225 RepID=UPI002FE0C9EF